MRVGIFTRHFEHELSKIQRISRAHPLLMLLSAAARMRRYGRALSGDKVPASGDPGPPLFSTVKEELEEEPVTS
jgi:hypothetical protein